MILILAITYKIYSNPNNAVRKAVINLSGRDFNKERLDKGLKAEYADFGWVVALAPVNDPEIAVACLLFQSEGSDAVGPIVREVIGDYFDLKKEREESEITIDYITMFEKHRQFEATLSTEEDEDQDREGE